MLLNQKKREKLGSNSFRVTRQDELLPSVLKTVRRAYSSYVSIKIGQLLLKSAKEQRIAAESVEEREGRLQLVRSNRDQRIASESSEERERSTFCSFAAMKNRELLVSLVVRERSACKGIYTVEPL